MSFADLIRKKSEKIKQGASLDVEEDLEVLLGKLTSEELDDFDKLVDPDVFL